MKKSYKKNGGGGKSDSTSVSSSPKVALVGLKKKSDNSTSYNQSKIHNISKLPTGPKNATVMVTKAQYRKKK